MLSCLNHSLYGKWLVSQDRSLAAGRAPTCLAMTLPSPRRTRVGIDWASNRRLKFGDSSTLTLTSFSRPAISAASCSRTGLTRRQGPHQGAHRSTSTGSFDPSATAAKSASEASATQGIGEWHLPQRGVPLATLGRGSWYDTLGTQRPSRSACRHSRSCRQYLCTELIESGSRAGRLLPG